MNGRPRLHLLEDLGDVLADQADREDGEGAEEHDEQHHGGDAARRELGIEQPREELQRLPSSTETSTRTTPVKVSTSSGVRLKDSIPFFAQPKFLSMLLVERPNMPLRARVRHARSGESRRRRASPRRNRSRSPHVKQPSHHPAVDEREIARIVRDRHRGEVIEDPVERLVGDLHVPHRLALDALAVNHVEPLAPFRDELGNELRRVLQIAVHQHHGILRRDLHAAAKGGLRAEIARMRDAENPRIRRAQSAGSPPRNRRDFRRSRK